MTAGAIVGTALVLGRWIAPPAAAANAIPRATMVGGSPAALGAAPSPSASSVSRVVAPWLTLHVLYAGCRCSEPIFAHLFGRGPIPGTHERILLVATRGDDPTAAGYRARATAAGFAVETVRSDDLARRFGIEAAPLLVIADPTGRIRYAGGYADGQSGKQAVALGDETIVANLMAGRGSTDIPLLTGAVSRRLQDALDPSTSPGRRAAP